MSLDQLSDWVDAGWKHAVAAEEGKPATWWPDQGQATTVAWAIVMQAARARCAANLVKGSHLTLNVNFHGDTHRAARKRLLAACWDGANLNPKHKHEDFEIVLDYMVHDWQAARPALMGAESEAYATHGVGDSMTTADDYSWDFYKLLLTRLPFRLMFARVGPVEGASGSHRRDGLAASFGRILGWYGGAYTDPGDEVAFVILPEARGAGDDWKDLRLGWWKHGDAAPEWSRPWASLR